MCVEQIPDIGYHRQKHYLEIPKTEFTVHRYNTREIGHKVQWLFKMTELAIRERGCHRVVLFVQTDKRTSVSRKPNQTDVPLLC